ncbi:MAG: hypothetical protein JXB03_13455 [Spirochaetales bacterium]|nr:hypothetical protein [Spirochaetales bacterium]
METKPVIKKKVIPPDAQFTVHWSPILPGDRFTIRQKVPSMSGIYQLFYQDPYKKLVLIDMDIAWYGGLRANLRDFSDPDKERDPKIKEILESKKLFCRYTLSESFRDLTDVLSLLAMEEFENWEEFETTGRYEHIFLIEDSPNKIVTI